MINSKHIIIRCPKCGREYLASEIFFPDDILGQPHSILRDDNGHIVHVDGVDPDLVQEWECDCGTTFQVRLDVAAQVVYTKDLDFSEEYTIALNDTDKENLF